VDDWNYNYIDEKNLRRFLRNMGCLASKQELVAMIRRFDTDGDAKINIEEFEEGIRS
jgi:Ca2+-binding EF-hand superfamily protein